MREQVAKIATGEPTRACHKNSLVFPKRLLTKLLRHLGPSHEVAFEQNWSDKVLRRQHSATHLWGRANELPADLPDSRPKISLVEASEEGRYSVRISVVAVGTSLGSGFDLLSF